MDIFLALLPTLVSIILTVLTRQVLVSLIAGIVLGSIVLSRSIILGFAGGADSIITILSTPWFIKNIIFLFLIGALLKVIEKSGGVDGFIYLLTDRIKLVKSRKGALFLPYLAGLGMFLDGVGSMMTAGMVGRPLMDEYHEPREKLAFICNATGAPIAFLFPFGGAAALMIGIIGGQINSGILTGSALSYVLRAIPFQFYTLSILIAVPCLIFFIKDFGPMARVYEDSDKKDNQKNIETHKGGRIDFMLVPLFILISTIIGIILYTGNGNMGRGDTTAGIYLGSIGTVIISSIYITMTSSISIEEFIGWCQEGMKSILPSVIILILASSLGSIMGELETGRYLSEIMLGNISPIFIPVGVFLTCCIISFSTGSSGATVMIMLPLIIPMGVDADIYIPLIIGAVISGAIFGDQSSPISDSIVVAAGAAGCDIVDHFKTQLPYTLSVAGVSMVLFIIFGFII